MKRALTKAVAILAMAMPSAAHAQQYLIAGEGEVATGVEGGGHGARRARTRIRVGLELRIDESPDDGLSVAGLVDLEPHASVGGELRYLHFVSETFSLHAGGIAYLAPGTLFGGTAGFDAHVPFGARAKKLSFIGGPEVTVFPAGSDLPGNSILWQALLQVGIRAAF